MANFYPAPEPRQTYPKVLPVTQGAQPKPAGPLGGSVSVLSAIGVWATLAAVPMPTQKPLNVAPLTLVYGQQPPRIDPSPKVQARVVIASWPEAGEPRLQFKNQQPERRYIAPLTLTYGQQPPTAGPLSVQEMAIARSSWEPPFVFPQELEGIAAVCVPPVVNNPPPRTLDQSIVRQTWEPAFQYPESEPNSASWNVPVVAQSFLPANETAWWIGAAWREPFGDIQFSGTFLPLTLSVDQPPIIGELTTAIMATTRGSWEPARAEPPRPVAIAPLSLTYGQQPTAYARLQDAILRAWVLDWSAQSEGDTAAWNVPIAIVNNPPPFAPQSHIVRMLWEPPFLYPESEANNAGWNIPAIVSPFTPFARLKHQLLAPAIWWPAQSASPNAAWNIGAAVAALTRAIAQSDATDALAAALSASSTASGVNSGTVLIVSVNSQTIALFSANDGVASIESSD